MKCLIACIDYELEEAITNIAKKYDICVLHARPSGSDVFGKVTQFNPDLVIMDLYLKKENALQVFKKIKKANINPETIIVSNEASSTVLLQAFNEGISDYILYSSGIKRIDNSIRRIICSDKKEVKLNSEIFIKIICNYKNTFISENRIVAVEKQTNRTNLIILSNGNSIITSTSIEGILSQGSYILQSPHRSYIININFIDLITPDPHIKGNYILENQTYNLRIPLTKKRYSGFIRNINTNFRMEGFV
ncbi:LytR/AlgR family response regulator transcription factor [Paenibacillus alvei]|uniref:LytR/AlgR family response regulator transcription factor n=1 Tax=Paenibacillus alvei TaxID=44250 RepID=UPI00155A295B|nr:response regulator [Paenibacillus alvei]